MKRTVMSKVHKKVEFKGEVYWLHQAPLGTSEYNLSPLEHYTDDGKLIANPFIDVSYAIVVDGKILRHGQVIGTMADLKEVK